MGNFIYETTNGLKIGKSDDTVLSEELYYGFSTREGGVSEGSLYSLNLGVNRPDTPENLRENYRRFCEALKIDANNVILPRQVHSDIITPVGVADRGKGLIIKSDLPDCDGLITRDKSVALGIFYADCTPVLLYDCKVKCLCMVHCGWRGTVKGFAKTGVETMVKKYGASPENIHAVIGPCIGKCHFEVGAEVAEEFKNAGKEMFVTVGNAPGKYYVDLKGTNKEFLLIAGLCPDNITVAPQCTYCNNDTFFSHRADGADTGRMAVIAEIR